MPNETHNEAVHGARRYGVVRAALTRVGVAYLLTLLLCPWVSCGCGTASPDEQLADAIRKAETDQTPRAYARALELALAADNWQAGLRLTETADAKFPEPEPELAGVMALGFWRAGRLSDAERVADEIPHDATDEFALLALLQAHFARGDVDTATTIADRLAETDPETPASYQWICRAHLTQGRTAAARAALRRGLAKLKSKQDERQASARAGFAALAALLKKAGPTPINQISGWGTAAMPMHRVFGLPTCEAFLNGEGPYRLILDSGAGDALFLAPWVAEEIQLDLLGRSTGIGFGGEAEFAYALLEELRLDEIVCQRVLTQVANEQSPFLLACDGVVGAGVFAGARMTLDFDQAQFRVSPSSDVPAEGCAAPFRVAATMHVFTEVELGGRVAAAFLDSGASVPLLSPLWLKERFPERTFQPVPYPLFGMGRTVLSPELAATTALRFAGRHTEDFSGLAVADLDEVLSPALGLQIRVVIGMSVLRDMKSWTIDCPRRRMWVEWVE